MVSRSKGISGSTGLIFTLFSPNGRYLFVDDRSGPFFPISQGILPWQSIFGEVCEMTFIQQAGVAKQIGTLQFRF